MNAKNVTVLPDDMLLIAFEAAAPEGYAVSGHDDSTMSCVAYRVGSDAERLNMSLVEFQRIIHEGPSACPA